MRLPHGKTAGVSPVVAVAGLRMGEVELDLALRRLRDFHIQTARTVAISARIQVFLLLHGWSSTALAPEMQANPWNFLTMVTDTAASFSLLDIFS